ncbi:HsdM family class I SAM-dependent methyltransferase [Pseudomonas nitroreducens]|uniref:HsdM family class I SAM-dependent methyltransferase n=1 Tax=Pseudomonas nitroreducens TaxID=46680 RepID=UPI001965DC4F|nr:N-6 DNA methylase [Pseudomonas nitroreducens]
MGEFSKSIDWLAALAEGSDPGVDGLVIVAGYDGRGKLPEEIVLMEKARAYGAYAVFFEASQHNRSPVAQAFVFLSSGPAEDAAFAQLHKRLWSWGGVPLIYRKSPGLVQLFRCAHKPDFAAPNGVPVCRPIKILKLAAKVKKADAWWDSTRLRNGTLWDDPAVCKLMLSSSKSAHRSLIEAVKQLNRELSNQKLLSPDLRRHLLILSLLIAYLEERGVLLPGYFAQQKAGASRFFEVLGDGVALVSMLRDLEGRFNGHVFSLSDAEREALALSPDLAHFARLIEAHEEPGGQLAFWQLYSFRDLPVELISHIYQLFVKDSGSSVYTPPALVRLILGEALDWSRLDRLISRGEVILDPSCGSGVFLVEAYKRLVLHWRSRNDWKKPGVVELRELLFHVHGVDLERGAIELAAFSLCLALCDALEPEEIRSSVKLFPSLDGITLHHSCFFEAKENRLISKEVGVVVGNPPFVSRLATEGARRSAMRYEKLYGKLPDNQIAYLFLHEAMDLVAEDGILSMLQQYGFIYNQKSAGFRDGFLDRWDVRELLDFISVRGLFQKGGADTKVVVVVAAARRPVPNSKILHAVFRRSGRADAEQGFDIDYYDLHWLPRVLVRNNPIAWRSNLLGGGRVYDFVKRLTSYPTLREFAETQNWDFGEGFIEGANGISNPAGHLIGYPLLSPDALTDDGVDEEKITEVPLKRIEGPRSRARFSPPYLAIRKHANLQHVVWSGRYLTYKSEIVGFAANGGAPEALERVSAWLLSESKALRAYVAAASTRLFTRKATALSSADIMALPYLDGGSLDLSKNEAILAEDIVEYQCDFIRLGDASTSLREVAGKDALLKYSACYVSQVGAVYKEVPLVALQPYRWPGVICYPFSFGEGAVDWADAEGLRGKLDCLLNEQRGAGLSITRIARVYDGQFIFLLKPDRLRYWLRSIALRDADETLAELRMQGF